jgi:putative restriction endonuclease
LRVNPRNGLCLCALHDRAFDRGLISVTPQFTLSVSPKLEAHLADEVVTIMFCAYRGRLVRLPEKFRPDPEYLTYHYTKIYQDG